VKSHSMKRIGAGIVATSLLLAVAVAPAVAAPPGGSSNNVSVVGTAEGVLASFTISAGESAPISVKITNNGKQTLNNVRLLLGQDDNPLSAPNGDATPPTVFPAGIAVTTSTAGCTGGAILDCALGTLSSRKSVTVNAIVTTTEATAATGQFLTEGIVSVAESGNDNGSNIDTFSAQGTMEILGFSCDAVTAYRPGNSNKDVSTCAIGDTDNGTAVGARHGCRRTIVVTLARKRRAARRGHPQRHRQESWPRSRGTPPRRLPVDDRHQLNGTYVTHNNLSSSTPTTRARSTRSPWPRRNACKTASSVNCGRPRCGRRAHVQRATRQREDRLLG